MSEKEKDIKKDKATNQTDSVKAMNAIQGGIVATVILGIILLLIYELISSYIIGKIIIYIIGILLFICIAVVISSIFDWKVAKRKEQLEKEIEKDQKELLETDLSKRALREEKMFKLNQKELMRYYEMNLSQTKFLSSLGIIMIVLGLIIVISSIILFVFFEFDKTLLIVGNISGIMIDFVGAVFIKMYTKNIEVAISFHSKFADSNKLLLANSIANKIEKENLREETLAEISKKIIEFK